MMNNLMCYLTFVQFRSPRGTKRDASLVGSSFEKQEHFVHFKL